MQGFIRGGDTCFVGIGFIGIRLVLAALSLLNLSAGVMSGIHQY